MDSIIEHIVLPTATDVATEAAAMITSEIASNNGLLLGLAGGSTPKATYAMLSGAPIDWAGVTTWMTDERWVPPTDPDSNQLMIRESLQTDGRITFLAPDTQLASPDAAATGMAKSLERVASGSHTRMVTILGLGDDGHTASLFPGTDALDVDDQTYVANWVPQHDTWRLTASAPTLSRSDVVVFLVSGETKAQAVASIARGNDLPAGRIGAKERVVWLLDEAAASNL